MRALNAAGEIFVADVHKSQVIYLADPQPCVPEPKDGRGRPSQRLQAQTPGIRVDRWLAQQPAEAWQCLTLRDSTRGELRVEALSRRVWLWDGEEKAAHCWHLIVRREIGSRNTIKFTLSNAPAETSLERLAQMQGQRYWVERSFQDAKSDCGMADYQVRKWTGWHHHMAIVMIAMLFMAEERTAQKDSVPLLSCADIITLLKHFLCSPPPLRARQSDGRGVRLRQGIQKPQPPCRDQGPACRDDGLTGVVAGGLRPLRAVVHPDGVAQCRHVPHRRRPRRRRSRPAALRASQ